MRRSRTRSIAAAVAGMALVAGALVVPSVSAQGASGQTRGWKPLHPNAYARAKAAADARAAAQPHGSLPRWARGAVSAKAPVAGPSWQGQFQTNLTPPDPTGAIGPTRFIQLTNTEYGIYMRNSALVSQGNLGTLTGHNVNNLSDPQIIWDSQTQRFYYEVLDFSNNTIAWGFSKSDTPSAAADFCSYTANFGYGNDLPDYPKMGDSKDFLLTGVNVFQGGFFYVGSDVDWITKPQNPAPFVNCPPQSAFPVGKSAHLHNADGSLTSTPNPADEVDTSAVGIVAGTADVSGGGSSNYISVFPVTKNPVTGAAVIGAPNTVPIPNYSLPASAQQKNTGATLDTLDGRLEHAVAAVDPRGGQMALWTAHAVFGGAGAEERWYEINPTAATVIQGGRVSNPEVFVWNGAISPDRVVNPSGSGFGDSMVMGFSASGNQLFPGIFMVSKIRGGAQSSPVAVKLSPGFNQDFSCSPCRWGDYSGATADPAAPLAGPTGKVWLSDEWNVASTDAFGTDWRTWNFGAMP